MVVSQSTEINSTNETSTKKKTGPELTLTTFGTRKRTRFGTWNVRTMMEATKLAQIAREFRSYKLELLGLSETRWKGSGERRLSTGETLLYCGKPETEDHSSGVGFLLSKKAKLCLTAWNPISDRIISLRLATKVRNLTLIQVYAPTEQAPDDVKDAFYQQLAHTLNNVKKSDILVLMGDLNAQVGSSNENWETVMGTHGLGTMNDNGELFAELCGNHDLVIGGTLFRHLNIHKVTWVSPDRRTQNQIDHIAISGKWRSSLLDVRNRRGADVYSDHHLLTGLMRIKLSTHRKREPTAPKRLDIAKLKDSVTAQNFTQNVSEIVSSSRRTDEDTSQRWRTVSNAMQQAGERTLGFRNNERKEWISDDTWNLIEERKYWKGVVNSTNDSVIKNEATQKRNVLDKEVKRKARADKRKFAKDLANQPQRASDSNNMRELARRISGKRPDADKPVRSADGSLVTTDSEQSERWSTYFEELLNQPPVTVPQSPIEPVRQRTFNESSPSSNEVKAAIKQLKNNKAPGVDNIAAEMLKADIELTTELLHPIVTEVWESEIIPEEFTDALIIKLAKRGDLTVCSNWRGITLLNTINKIISIIIHDRISKVLEPIIRKQQGGFRPHRSCIDNINSLRIIMEQSAEFNAPLYLLFIDFKQAFDSLV
jgi:Reverse transcriptase (RNA-dependent DNA polymerase)/Endonuclease/Exonuclease/phosphatase family